MTLASRLSTLANLGHLSDAKKARHVVTGNLALVQIQAIVVGTLAALFAMTIAWLPVGKFNLGQSLLLVTSSVVTAATASFVLGLIMVLVIRLSAIWQINPDNVATPIAASLGDLATLAILSLVSSALKTQPWLCSVALAVFFVAIPPFAINLAFNCDQVRDLLLKGWTPVLSAMIISSLGGKILNSAIVDHPNIAAFQPIINGVAGNLVAVQASRISTRFHKEGKAADSDQEGVGVILSVRGGSNRVTSTAFCFVIPGHAIFLQILNWIEPNPTVNSTKFMSLYFAVALIQVGLLLLFAGKLVRWLWKAGIDPDSAAIPYLTSLGDLLGGFFLSASFYLKDQI